MTTNNNKKATDELFQSVVKKQKEREKTYLVPMSIRIENNKVLCNKFGSDFIDLLGDLGWEYQRMGRSGRETYDEIMQMLGIIKPDEVYMEID